MENNPLIVIGALVIILLCIVGISKIITVKKPKTPGRLVLLDILIIDQKHKMLVVAWDEREFCIILGGRDPVVFKS
jgi:purine-cytosine permease-like protein